MALGPDICWYGGSWAYAPGRLDTRAKSVRLWKEFVLRALRGMRLIGVLAVGALVLGAAACGKAPAKNNAGGGGKSIKTCMVTDTGGINDKSFNAAAWKGLQDAKAQNSKISAVYTESHTEADYVPGLTSYAQQKCDLTIAVGGLMGDALTTVAKQYPNQKFAIIDANVALPNVFSMQFDTAQAGYLAGYLSAGMTKSGTVGTYGGAKIPPVTIFMDGFVDGVAHYNQVHNKSIKVLGWNKTTQNGSFVPGANPFTDQNGGKQISDTMVAQGADIIMPVAGGSGLGTAAAAQQSNGKYSVIWVDQDGCVSAAQYCSVFLSTVEKNIADAVKNAALKAADGSLQGGTGSIGTLSNNGVELAPFHDFDSKVSAALKSEIDKLRQDIISGTIQVTSPAAPK
jgi:basic membrane protein A and related proteins